MSVRTTADECKDEFVEHLDKAYTSLSKFIDPDTWGHSDYSSEYMIKMEEIHHKLLKLRRKLKER